MKIHIEVNDEIIVELLKDMQRSAIASSLPDQLPMDEASFADLRYALKIAEACEFLILHCDGEPVELHTIKRKCYEKLAF